MTQKRRVWCLVVAGVLTLAACGAQDGESGGDFDAPAAGDEQQPYRIMVTGAVSGSGVLVDNAGTSILAAEAAVSRINEAGGFAGREAEIVVVDDGADATTAVTALQEAVATEKPDAYLNSGPSTIAAATLPILAQHDILSFNIGPTEDSSDAATFPLNFDLSPGAPDYAEGFVPYIEEQGYSTVAVLHDSTAWGTTFGPELEDVFTDAGIEVLAVQEYDFEALDMTPELQAVQATDPDALVLDGYGPAVGYVLQGLDKLGWEVPVVGDNAVSATGLVSIEPPSGVLGTSQVDNLVMQVFTSTKHDPDADAVNEAVATMADLGEIHSTLILAYNYDAVPLIAAAAQSVGSAEDPHALATALEDPQVQDAAETVILSRYNFTDDDHSPRTEPGDFLFIEPSELVDGQFQ